MRKIRCAIYTRKSSEEGLEQAFNSLHAQREACAAYVASQKHEGWVLLPEQYDDGGISGGTLERDALRRLMHQVDEGLVDQIVVYKIDRLTRSLADFAKLVERLDAAGASFVSVTQSFNTATSMGRLTLNVLLSFAQFEREVTAERIRDKIAASKKKGLWMGGTVPLGYEAQGRSLTIVEGEAKTVRTLFALYRKHRSIVATTRAAEGAGLRTKTRAGGLGGNPIGRSHVHAILTNPIYAGRIRHKETSYPGQHEAIIAPEEWDAIQQMLMKEARRSRGRRGPEAARSQNGSLLAGRLFDESGDMLTPSHANKNGRRYRYYVSSRLIRGAASVADQPPTTNHTKGTTGALGKAGVAQKEEGNGVRTSESSPSNSRFDGWRLPAPAVEAELAAAIHRHVKSVILVRIIAQRDITETERLQQHMNALAERSDAISLWCGLLARADLKAGHIIIRLDGERLTELLDGHTKSLAETFERDAEQIQERITITKEGSDHSISIEAQEPSADAFTFAEPFRIRKRGVEAKLIIGDHSPAAMDRTLIDNLARAHDFARMLRVGHSVEEIGTYHGISRIRVLQLLPLAFLAPDISRDILHGRQPIGLTSQWLQVNSLPLDWQQQRQMIAAL